MDVLNTRIGQSIAKDSAATINDKTFNASSLVGYSSGVSQFAKSDNNHTTQQVKNTEKTLVNLPDKWTGESDNKRKVNAKNADNLLREENVSFSASLSNINELLQTNGTNISFSIENGKERPVIIVTDQDSGNVIRQIPTEEVQKFAERLREIESGSSNNVGLVFERQA